ncbi:glutaredoxin 3 [Fluviicoccus keumensis]|uniref:Glutaredoxin n=1 Tax=Fluviicoccus keumensis TaxID=1435465 RepID=A0A4Q7ZBS0_9GAMM|nr:glutaredoxin 3 [Fluviicoccus keumensis]RZU48077.1 glutaredoxin 3 [Fluviicoccus keumensis]
MKTVTLYSTATCPWCVQAENLLNRIGAPVEKIRVDQSAAQLDTMIARSGRRTVPQIFIGERHIGGFSELHALEQQGVLSPLLHD